MSSRILSTRLGACVLSSLLLCSCFSATDGEALKRDVAILKKQVSQGVDKGEEERKRLQKVMVKATALLTRNSADVGAQVDRINAANNKLKGQLEELRNAIGKINKQLSILEAKVSSNTQTSQAQAVTVVAPKSKDELFNLGVKKLAAGDHINGRKLLRKFLAKASDDRRSSGVQLRIGQSYYVQQKFAAAAVEFRKVLRNYQKSKEAADALYKIGMAFYQLKFCSDAQTFFTQFIRKHRRHRDVKNARKVMRLIRRYKNNRQFCSS